MLLPDSFRTVLYSILFRRFVGSCIEQVFQLLETSRRPEHDEYADKSWINSKNGQLLFSGLKDAPSFLVPPWHQLRHPLIFYYGHVASLYVNKLRVAGLLDGPINPHFEALSILYLLRKQPNQIPFW